MDMLEYWMSHVSMFHRVALQYSTLRAKYYNEKPNNTVGWRESTVIPEVASAVLLQRSIWLVRSDDVIITVE
jgi:hypothetical protein